VDKAASKPFVLNIQVQSVAKLISKELAEKGSAGDAAGKAVETTKGGFRKI
jgi:hypothetical protein